MDTDSMRPTTAQRMAGTMSLSIGMEPWKSQYAKVGAGRPRGMAPTVGITAWSLAP